jgi:hypothetical protein
MINAYRFLLHLYPADFRARFQGEMLCAFEESHQPIRELASLAAAIPKEWIARWTTPPAVRARWIRDWRFMRPPGVSREEYFGSDPADLLDAQRRANFCLARMKESIALRNHHDAKFYSREDLKAREQLKRVREKYGLA